MPQRRPALIRPRLLGWWLPRRRRRRRNRFPYSCEWQRRRWPPRRRRVVVGHKVRASESSTTGLLGSYHPCLGVTPGGRCVLSTGNPSSISVTNLHGSCAQSSRFSTHWNQLCTPGCVTCPLHIHCTSTSWSSNSWVALSSGVDNSGPANHVPKSACHNQNGLLSVLFAL